MWQLGEPRRGERAGSRGESCPNACLSRILIAIRTRNDENRLCYSERMPYERSNGNHGSYSCETIMLL